MNSQKDGSRKITLDQAALAAERAYRRGFQHGVNAVYKSDITDEHAYNFRYETSYAKPFAAPEKYIDAGIKIAPPIGGATLIDLLLQENPELRRTSE